MSTINDGGPAFPLQSIGPEFAPGYAGMTLRDYFAAKAMAGFMANTRFFEDVGGTDSSRTARLAYLTADAMLAARKEKP